MRKIIKCLSFIVFIVVIGFTVLSCDLFGEGNPFIGKWDGIDPDGRKIRIEFTQTRYKMSRPSDGFHIRDRFKYTYKDDTATLLNKKEEKWATAILSASGNSLTVYMRGWGIGYFELKKQ